MNPAESPHLKSHTPTTGQPHPAEPAVTPTDRGAPKVAARQGVPSSSNPPPKTVPAEQQMVVSWLRITAPDRRNDPPTAESWCRCGRHRTATGRANVLRLTQLHDRHRDTCPLNLASAERKAS